ncbi:hypothetical protein OO015_07760 [Thermomicrobium sp. 4228-Ro]|uniref:hypothetical protein n=1 Tax=Thermomicrobium sp. 4228-Ro TaxID=2993937 RepID=UPI002248E369|nr:hypothetical protein [Thermomicrobium sp. 4228-Ro]MCX2727391.1 hypothetical protein [Thermomicrobium sp. 4228-Ro]
MIWKREEIDDDARLRVTGSYRNILSFENRALFDVEFKVTVGKPEASGSAAFIPNPRHLVFKWFYR